MEHDAGPIVCIGLPVYNGGDRLRDALDCLLGQTHTNLRLIISDNASTDETESICRAAARDDARVEYHRQDANLGPWPNFRFVLAQAQGPYFMWASHDDRWETGYVEACLKRFDERPDLALVFTQYDSILLQEGEVRERQAFPALQPIYAAPAAKQLSAWILLEEYSQKANLIYGLWKTEVARDAMTRFGDRDDMVYKGLDIIMLTYLLARYRVEQIEEKLFTKCYEQYLLGAPSTRLRGVRSFLTRPFATLSKGFAFARDHVRGLRDALLAADALTTRLRLVLMLKRVIYFLPVYRYLASTGNILRWVGTPRN